MKREKNMEPLKAVIDRLLKDFKLEGKLLEKQVAHEWKLMLGQLIARKTKSITLRNGALEVVLESAVIRSELDFAKEKLMSKLNERLGKEVIKTIWLR